ncbi:MAG: helix-turn-helix domain-containing protein [Bacteroidota bacterium]
MKIKLPVYKIQHFEHEEHDPDFYANDFLSHITHHHFATAPHKHDFYLTVLFTKGNGTHEIDFNTYEIKPGLVFTMLPGQMHNWKTSLDIDGYVFFHTKSFYDSGFNKTGVNDFPFFQSLQNPPFIELEKSSVKKLEPLFRELVVEHEEKHYLKLEKIHTLVNLIYVELSRLYSVNISVHNQNYLAKVRILENFIDKNFKTKKYPHEYANLMNLSEKHLNRMSKVCLNKTTTELIAERIILEAKRLLTHSKQTISEVANELGYQNNSYFSRFFKKHAKETPVQFLNKHR